MATKVVHVRAHERIIYTRLYKFVCAECKYAVERETYAVNCPKYCVNCRPPQPSKSVTRHGQVANMVKNLADDTSTPTKNGNGNLADSQVAPLPIS